ncbi:MAG: acyl-CoA thioesterase II [Aquisalimonadaceae bacterium]
MQTLVDKLVNLLEIERLELNLFRGESRNILGKRVFGGQVLGQALVAAGRTVESDRNVHSLHAYFLRAGDASAPIIYEVERARDGGSYSTRRIVAIQHGRPIFNMSASFQVTESGYEHQFPAPEAPPPEGLENEWDILMRHRDQLPETYQDSFVKARPIEIRPTRAEDPMNPVKEDPVRQTWFRTAAALGEDPLIHQALLAYASDYGLLATALLPHGRSMFQRRTQMASLDHAMWFHRPFRMDEWLLYSMDSPSASNARGFTRGNIFNRDGVMIASVAQEGQLRPL